MGDVGLGTMTAPHRLGCWWWGAPGKAYPKSMSALKLDYVLGPKMFLCKQVISKLGLTVSGCVSLSEAGSDGAYSLKFVLLVNGDNGFEIEVANIDFLRGN